MYDAQLKAIVSLYLTNGGEPIDGCNDTRYWALADGWHEAYELTHALVRDGLLVAQREDDMSRVTPTAKGIFVALGGVLHEEG